MNIKHVLFVHHYIMTGSQTMAYKAAYPKASGNALVTAASRLINQPHIRQNIKEKLTEALDRAETELKLRKSINDDLTSKNQLNHT